MKTCSTMDRRLRWLPLAAFVMTSGCIGNRFERPVTHGSNPSVPVLNVNVTIPLVPIHRLTRYEYNLTVHDLLGTMQHPADAFPIDPVNGGFDNVAANLTLTPQLLGLYNTAAHSLANELTQQQPLWQVTVLPPMVGLQANPSGAPLSNWGWLIVGEFDFTVTVPRDDDVAIAWVAGGQAINAPTPHMTFKIDGTAVSATSITAAITLPATYTAATHLAAGSHSVAIVFDNKVDDKDMTSNTDSELGIGTVTLASTTIAPNPSFTKLFSCDPNQGSAEQQAQCWQTTALSFARRAWRRPLTQAETTQLSSFWTQLTAGLDNSDAMNYLVQAVLVSPPFLYRTTRPAAAATDGITYIDDYDLASRISYFLWSSMPDDALLQDAASGALRTDDGLRATVARMLTDPRVAGLQGGFAAQWLQTRQLDQAAPDPTVFPTWDANLKAALVNESLLFFNDYLSNQLPIANMLEPNFIFINDRLAAHYQLPAPNSATSVKQALPDGARSGLLTQGAWLTSNSVQTRTSAVKRGRFVLQNMLCTPIGAPPPGVPPLPAASSTAPQTQRQALLQHASDPQCGSCHNLIDPPGFGLELFDGIGRSRTTDGNQSIDASATLNGQSFQTPREMAKIIETDPAFVACVAKQLFAYALNRSIVDSDTAALSDIVERTNTGGQRLDEMITQIVLSPQFRWAANGAAP